MRAILALVLFVLLASCGTASSVCREDRCTCGEGSSCDFDCPTCEVTCTHATCNASASGKGTFTCNQGSTCTLEGGADSRITCNTMSTCMITAGDGSEITCSSATCEIRCSGMCDIACTGEGTGAMSCPDLRTVCHRPC